MIISLARIQKWERQQNISRLIDALQTTNDDLRQSVCLTLGRTNSIHALNALQYIEQHDTNEFVRISAMKSIKNLMNTIDFKEQETLVANEQLSLKPVHLFN